MKRKMDWFETILFVVISLYVLSIIFVLGFGLLNSVKHFLDFETGNVFGLPSPKFGWKFSNYIDVFDKCKVAVILEDRTSYVYIEQMFLNSLVYAVIVTVFAISTQLTVAYAVAKYDFKLRKIYYNLAIIVMLIPIVGSLPSQMRFAEVLGLKGSFLGIAIMRCSYPGMHFLIFYAMFKNISWSYAEAAQIDGAGHFKIFIEIMLPLSMSTIVAVFILQFIAHWNEYYTPMLFAPNKVTIAYGLYRFSKTTTDVDIRITTVLASCLLSCLPIIALFIIFRNKIMGKVNVGGMKG